MQDHHEESHGAVHRSRQHRVERQLLPAIAKQVGPVRTVVPLGSWDNTYLVETRDAKVVAKRMAYVRSPAVCARIFNRLSALPSPACPPLVVSIECDECWFAVFEYVEGVAPEASDTEWNSHWEAAFGLLRQFQGWEDVMPEWDIALLWLEMLAQFDFRWDAAWDLSRHLVDTVPTGPRMLTHGDFGAHNFLLTAKGLILVDWEEIGAAPLGFDAGWVLALNRVGTGPRRSQVTLIAELCAAGYPERNLRWFEGLGLLRLLYRAMVLPINPDYQLFVIHGLRATIAAYEARM